MFLRVLQSQGYTSLLDHSSSIQIQQQYKVQGAIFTILASYSLITAGS